MFKKDTNFEYSVLCTSGNDDGMGVWVVLISHGRRIMHALGDVTDKLQKILIAMDKKKK